jgi:hypothetical protein
MRWILNWPVIIAVALIITWLYAGRGFTSLLDRLITLRVASLPVSPIKFDGDLLIGQVDMTFGATDNLRSNLVLCSDSLNRVVLSTGGRSFRLGPRTNPVDPSGRPEIDFVPDPGDELSFTSRRSVFGWPTPFEFNFMMRSPWWKRYVYYRLVWKKRKQAKLEMLWRYEQEYYSTTGWTAPEMMWNWHTGLIRVDIHR